MQKKATFKSLTKEEKQDLRTVAGVTTLSGFKDMAEVQKLMRDTGKTEPCFECKAIARKLGIEV